ncbi:MAG: hypothetical protein V7K48_21840 [Nostoc sp.]
MTLTQAYWSLGATATTGQRSFAIAAAPCLYLLESRERRQQTIYEAWLIIDNAAAARVATSYTRFKALVSIMPAMGYRHHRRSLLAW